MTPQVKTLLTHLQKHGSISQAEAATVYRIRALPRRISDLKEAGHKITRELKQDPTGQRYARYTLVEPDLTLRVGATVEVVKPYITYGENILGSVGIVTDIDEDGDVDVRFKHRTDVCFLINSAVKVIA